MNDYSTIIYFKKTCVRKLHFQNISFNAITLRNLVMSITQTRKTFGFSNSFKCVILQKQTFFYDFPQKTKVNSYGYQCFNEFSNEYRYKCFSKPIVCL